MAKRFLSLLLIISMLLGMFPGTVLAAETPTTEVTVIESADDLAALVGKPLIGDYQLGADIDMSLQENMRPITYLDGTFDGNGHTIRNLTISYSGSAGLFTTVRSNSEVKNLLLEDCAITGTGSTGMLAGEVQSNVAINYCGVVGGQVNATDSYGNAGGLIGQVSYNTGISVTDSFSTANVKSNNYRAGGLIGNANGAQIEFTNCYATGMVTAATSYNGTAGGFAGYISCSGSGKGFYATNCYATGELSGNATYGFANVYSNLGTLENCYYVSDLPDAETPPAGVTALDADTLKGLADAGTLGEAYIPAVENANGGYPMLKWQDPNATYDLVLTVSPADAQVTLTSLEGGEQAADTVADGVYTYKHLAPGSAFTYLVAQNDAADTDLAAESGTITIGTANVNRTITLQPNRYDLTFQLTPTDAALTVTDTEGKTLAPTTEGGLTYNLPNGSYTYSVTAFGYQTVTDTIRVDKGDATQPVTLELADIQTVTFGFQPEGQTIQNQSLTVEAQLADNASKAMAPKEENGLVYDLPVGYVYQYSFRSGNFATVTDTLDLTAAAGGQQTVTIPLGEKTAWEGPDDIQPAPQVEGVYQISSGAQLAWFAQQVNGNQLGSDVQAVLTSDIDLGGHDWTPMGTSSNPFKGTLDGGYHTIKGLYINTSSAYQGLFGSISGGSVQNLTVRGDVTSSGSNVGAITGCLTGSDALLENCVSQVNVSGGYSAVGGLVGKIDSSGAKNIRYCLNQGTVKGTNQVGGLIGYAYYKVNLTSCYNVGNVQGTSYVGGIAGQQNDSNAIITNCYTTGTVTGNSNAKAGIGAKSSGTITNCYALEGVGAEDSNVPFRTRAELQSPDFLTILGEPFIADVGQINQGYPIFPYQDTTVYYPVTINVNVDHATVLLKDNSQKEIAPTKVEGRIFHYQLAAGTYDCVVTAFGKTTQKGTLKVKETTEPQNTTVELADAATHQLQFQLTFADGNPTGVTPAISIQADAFPDVALTPQTDGSYRLPSGSYTYTIRATGYKTSRQTITIEEQDQVIPHQLTVYNGWDGATTEQPQQAAGVYQIETAEQLAWFAGLVNGTLADTAKNSSAKALLTADIALYNQEWTPVGKDYSNYYAGTFDGGNHTISGLSVTNGSSYYGLFGTVKGATIQNVVVQGIVAGPDSYHSGAGGIAGYDQGGSQFLNCGNQAAVSSLYTAAGGILGGLSGNTSRIIGCYNTGAVTSTSSIGAGGMLGNGGSNTILIQDCYNTGAISAFQDGAGTGKATGIVQNAGISATVTNCYNIGTLTVNPDSKTYAIAYGTTNLTNCHYLDTLTGVADASKATAQDSQTMQTAAFISTLGANWKADGSGDHSINQGYPVLSWQTVQTETEEPGGQLQQPYPSWEHGYTEEGLAYLYPNAVWQGIPGASSYTIKLYNWNQDLVDTIAGITTADDCYDAATNQFNYDMIPALQQAGNQAGVNDTYEFTVTAIGDGDRYTDSLESLSSGILDYVVTKLDALTEVSWQGNLPIARWDYVDFASYYEAVLYKDGVMSTSVLTGDTYYDFSAFIRSEGDYTFAVAAYPAHDEALASDLSPQSGVYRYEVTTPEDPELQWELISTPADLVALGNVKDQATGETDPSGNPINLQQVAWSKNYKLAGDIDLSGLSAEEVAKGLAIGNTKHPFSGIFDGDGHTITGLTLSNGDGGLFDTIGASGLIRNLTLENANVLYSDNAGILAVNNYGTISNCAVVNSNITAHTGAIIGGFVGRNYGTIKQSYVLGGKLTANSETGNGHAGFAGNNSGTIKECYTTMEVQSASYSAGGFVGWSDNGGSFENCFALGNVRAAYGWSGGFVGRINDSYSSFRNCYAFNTVSSEQKPDHVYGFVGSLGSEAQEDLWEDWQGTFHPEYAPGSFATCYYSSDLTPQDNAKTNATAKTTAELKTQAMATALGSRWSWSASQNNGLPYLVAVTPPASIPTEQISVQLALGTYDKSSYSFNQLGAVVNVTLESNGNTRVVDVLDAAQAQGLLRYEYATTPSFGRYIYSINGYGVAQPDGWMFTINDQLSNLSASLATVGNGDKLLWFEGTTENRFQGPTWQQLLEGSNIEWQEISSIQDLQELSQASDADTLAKHYRLTQDLDFTGVTLSPIGSMATPFTGTFDGNGKTLANLSLQGEDNTGLFGVIQNATIKNLKLENATISGKNNVGALVGYAKAKLNKEDMGQSEANLIGSCQVSGTVTGTSNVGGLLGYNEGQYDPDTLFSIYSAVDQCSAQVTVNATARDASNIGGLVGRNDGTITASSAQGPVTAANGTLVGGLAGYSDAGIYDCHATGAVSGDSTVGGLVGSVGANAIIKNCYSLGDVAGTDGLVGGFAGSISGKVEHCLSAGTVTPSTGIGGYNGGFTASFSGKLATQENQRTLKDSYGNCVAADGSLLNAIGNHTQFQGESNQAVLAAMQLTSKQQVATKLYEMFGLNLDVPQELLTEADKYADLVAIPHATEVGAAINLLRQGQSAAADVTVTVATASDYLAGGDSLTLQQQNATPGTLTESAVLAFTDSQGNTYLKTVSVVLKTAANAYDNLLDTIASTFTTSSDGWTVLDMAAYGKLEGKTHATSADAYQNALNLSITEAKGGASISGRSRLEMVLRAMGIDSTKLYPVNSNQAVNNAKLLADNKLETMIQYGYYDAPWILLAELQGNTKLDQTQIQGLLDVLQDNMGEDGLFSYEWDHVTYTSPDTAGTVLAAIAPYYSSNATAQHIGDTILQGLAAAQGANGSYGSANSDAMVILGLTAMGIDPANDSRFVKNGCSLVDGLLSYLNEAGTAFQFLGQDNALANEQGFRALVALAHFQAGGNQAYNLYDFSKTPVQPGRATGEGQVEKPSDPPTNNPDIKVTFTLKTDSQTWIAKHTVTIKEGSTVYHAFTQVLDSRGLTYTGAEKGYVDSITKGNVTLSAFDKGANSGWLYKVNDVVPTVGLTSYTLKDGDDIVWYYTTDWTKDSGAKANLSSSNTAEGQNPLLTPEATVKDGHATATVEARALQNATSLAAKQEASLIRIQPSGADDVLSLTVEVAKTAIKDMVDSCNAGLQIENDLGTITITSKGLADLAAESGATVYFSLAKQQAGGMELSVKVGNLTMDQLAGGLKASIPAASGNVVVQVNADGSQQIIKHSVVEQGVAYFLLEGSATVKVEDRSKAFQDVATDSWYKQAVDFALSHQLYQGLSESSFGPNEAMTRAMLVTVLHRLEDTPQASKDASFTDLAPNAWYQQAVAWANEQNIVNGLSATTFGPDQAISRQDLALILYRYAKASGLATTSSGSLSQFRDADQVAAWAKEAVQWAVGCNILTGSDGSLQPQGNATRAEVATMLQRYIRLVVK